jgi:hypothetical protein
MIIDLKYQMGQEVIAKIFTTEEDIEVRSITYTRSIPGLLSKIGYISPDINKLDITNPTWRE